MSDFTVLVQGPMHRESIIGLSDFSKYGPIIFSCWEGLNEDGEHNLKTLRLQPEITVVCEPEPPPMGLTELTSTARGSTFYKAIASVYYGLQKCKTKYVIKIRSDERFSDLEPLIEKFLEDDNKMVCGNIFFKRWGFRPYHIGDHLFVAKTETLKKAYERLYKIYNLRNVVPDSYEVQGGSPDYSAEQVLAHSFLRASNAPEFLNKEEVCRKYFDVIDINLLGEYVVGWKHGSKIFGSGGDLAPFVEKDWECIKTMEDL